MRLQAKRYKFENNRRIRSKLPTANLQVACAPASCSLASQNPSQLHNNRSLIKNTVDLYAGKYTLVLIKVLRIQPYALINYLLKFSSQRKREHWKPWF